MQNLNTEYSQKAMSILFKMTSTPKSKVQQNQLAQLPGDGFGNNNNICSISDDKSVHDNVSTAGENKGVNDTTASITFVSCMIKTIWFNTISSCLILFPWNNQPQIGVVPKQTENSSVKNAESVNTTTEQNLTIATASATASASAQVTISFALILDPT